MAKKRKKPDFEREWHYGCGWWLASFIILAGFLWYARDIGWISKDVPIWVLFLILFGICLFVGKRFCYK